MLGVLFWNLHGHDLGTSICWIARKYKIGLIVLAESRKHHRFAKQLSAATGNTFDAFRIPGCAYLRVLTTLQPPQLTIIEADNRHVILRIHRRPHHDMLLAFSHLPPKGPGENSVSNQRDAAGDLHQRIMFQEQAVGHQRTVLAGDLNMDPFETGIIDAKGLHAVSSRNVAARITRKIRGKPSPRCFSIPCGDMLVILCKDHPEPITRVAV